MELKPKGSPLPTGVGRDRHCRLSVTLDDCVAIQVYFDDGTSAILWSDMPKHVVPKHGKRLRDLRYGDSVLAFGKEKTVVSIEVYR